MKGKRIDGIVVKVTEHTIVTMCHDGTFKNIPRSPDQIPRMGESFSYIERDKRSKPLWLTYISVASVFLMGILLYTLFLQSGPQASYVVAMDINPSMELYVDQNDTVVKAVALNQDAEKIINNIEFKHVKLSQVSEEILSRSIQEGYLSKDMNGMITTSIVPLLGNAQDISVDKISKDLEQHMQQSLAKQGVIAQVSVTIDEEAALKEAHQLDLSINKHKLYQRFVEEGLDITLEEVKSESMAELRKKEKIKKDQLKRMENEKQTTKPRSSAEQAVQKQNNKNATDSTKKQERNEGNPGSHEEKDQNNNQRNQDRQNTQTPTGPKAGNKQDEQGKQNKLDKQDEKTSLDEKDDSTERTEKEVEKTEQTEKTEHEEDSSSEQEQKDRREGSTSGDSTEIESEAPPTNQAGNTRRP